MIIDCPHCEARTQYKVSHLGVIARAVGFHEVDRQSVAAECTQCLTMVVATVSPTNQNAVYDFHPRTLVRKAFPDVPPAVASAAGEAHLCLSAGAPRGAVALARAVVESTAKAQGVDKGTLEQKIDKLAGQGAIREHTRVAAHEVRHYGNEVAHGDLVDQSVTPAEATEVLILMDLILREVFQDPAQVRKLQETRERRLRGEPDPTSAQPAPAPVGSCRILGKEAAGWTLTAVCADDWAERRLTARPRL